jgi:peptidoglycan/xylan/chitin deacetylase (PgdA/CDA1 family)
MTASAELVVNLCFHGIGEPRRPLEPGEASYWMAEDQFAAVLDAVRSLPFVRLSVDDGNKSDVELVLPALVARDMTATFFVLAGRLDSPGSLGEQDVRELHGAGMRVGSHGFSHTPWPELSAELLDQELVLARQILATLIDAPVDHAACPLGRHDDTTLERLRDLGYARVFTSARRAVDPDAWAQPRFSVRSTDSPATIRRMALLALTVARGKTAG